MIIKYSKNYKKKILKLNNYIKQKVIERITIFLENPFDEQLNNHQLTWKLKWKRSINITWDFRAVFREYPNWTYEFVEFIDVWTHSQLYW